MSDENEDEIAEKEEALERRDRELEAQEQEAELDALEAREHEAEMEALEARQQADHDIYTAAADLEEAEQAEAGILAADGQECAELAEMTARRCGFETEGAMLTFTQTVGSLVGALYTTYEEGDAMKGIACAQAARDTIRRGMPGLSPEQGYILWEVAIAAYQAGVTGESPIDVQLVKLDDTDEPEGNLH